MDTFNINLLIDECLSCRCNSCNKTINKIITSLNDFISLECNYYLKILSVQNNYIIISIDNGSFFIVRKIYTSIPVKICIPNNCCAHRLCIKVNSITT